MNFPLSLIPVSNGIVSKIDTPQMLDSSSSKQFGSKDIFHSLHETRQLSHADWIQCILYRIGFVMSLTERERNRFEWNESNCILKGFYINANRMIYRWILSFLSMFTVLRRKSLWFSSSIYFRSSEAVMVLILVTIWLLLFCPISLVCTNRSACERFYDLLSIVSIYFCENRLSWCLFWAPRLIETLSGAKWLDFVQE